MKILFFGTSGFAIPSLKRLAKLHNVACVITRPDKPCRRGYKISHPPIFSVAEELEINVIQPDVLDISIIKEISPDIIVVVAYGGILPSGIIYFPKYGSINLHPSLLPKYRGPAPISWALIQGETKTGITIAEISTGIDDGDIILQKEVDILPDDDYEILASRLAEIGADCLAFAISAIKEQKIEKKKQEGEPSYAPKIKGRVIINWGDENRKIANLIRGIPKETGCWTKYGNSWIKILKGWVYSAKGEPGVLMGTKDNGIIIGCRDASVVIELLQKEGKKPISGKDFLSGIKDRPIIFR
ncbi:TPA: methionyl-tRNA formyltransferase [bacterium]|nr:methionyl-tRNA formyltransferase [bacterium]